VTIPISFFPFFTNSDPTRAVFIFLAALTIDTAGPTVLGCLLIIFATVDISSPLSIVDLLDENFPSVFIGQIY
jgi:hypothetical protein